MAEEKLCPFISTGQFLASGLHGGAVPETIPPEIAAGALLRGVKIGGQSGHAFKIAAEFTYPPGSDGKTAKAMPVSVPCLRDKCQLWSENAQECKLGLIADRLESLHRRTES